MAEIVLASQTLLDGNVVDVHHQHTDSVLKDANVSFFVHTCECYFNFLLVACDCNSIGSLTAECDLITGQCDCHPNTYGRECK